MDPAIDTSEAVPDAPTTNVVKEARRVSNRSRRVFWSFFVDPDSPTEDDDDDANVSLVITSSSFFFTLSDGLVGDWIEGDAAAAAIAIAIAVGGKNQWAERADGGEATIFSV